MLDTAKIFFGGSVIDCVVLDVSLCGVNVKTGTVVTVPETVTIRRSDGRVFEATRRWARGLEIGFSFRTPAPPGAAVVRN